MSLPEVDTLEKLPGPYEILEMVDGATIALHPEAFQVGWMTIEQAGGRGPKKIVALRVHVPRSDKPIGPGFWDITAQHLVNDLIPQLQAAAGRPLAVKITKHGVAPKARFTVEVIPAG